MPPGCVYHTSMPRSATQSTKSSISMPANVLQSPEPSVRRITKWNSARLTRRSSGMPGRSGLAGTGMGARRAADGRGWSAIR